MANNENSNEKQERSGKLAAASTVISGAVAKALEVKQSNPKLFFAGIGIAVLLIIVLMSGGEDSSKKLTKITVANVVIGQTYELRSVNTYDSKSTVRLVAVPGSMAAYDDTEREDRVGGCKHMAQGTPVKVLQIQGAFKTAKFVEVEITAGECAGKKGWTIINNLKT